MKLAGKLCFPLAALAACTLTLLAQDNSADQLKHLSVPTSTSVRPISIAALTIEREPSIIHLKGNVEIKTPICLIVGSNHTPLCVGYLILKADGADLDEHSGQIEATGHVTLKREN